jgi:hypothetical protein
MPEVAPEFVQFGTRNTTQFGKLCENLDPGLRGELCMIQISLSEDPRRYPERVTPIGNDFFVYKNPNPPLIVMYRLDNVNKVIYFTFVDGLMSAAKLMAMQAEAPTAVPVAEPIEKEVQEIAIPVFVSYSHWDKSYLEELKLFFKPLANRTDLWFDDQIEPSDLWREEIKKALTAARAAILLVSQTFLVSDFISKNELPPLLDRARTQGVKIFWIAVRSSTWKDSPIEPYQALNDPNRPLERLSKAERNSTFVQIYEKFKKKMTEV